MLTKGSVLGTVEYGVGPICNSGGCELPIKSGIRGAERSTRCGDPATVSLARAPLALQTLLTRYRYLSQVRQELAMRLLARVYANGSTPSKVSAVTLSLRIGAGIDYMTVVAEFYEAQIHGQIVVEAYYRYQQEMDPPLTVESEKDPYAILQRTSV